MRKYDLIVIGTGSAMSVADVMMREDPTLRVAVVDKDDPGGICLTRGCIPTKILVYPAEVLRLIERAGDFGIDVDVKKVDFVKIMERMRMLIGKDIEMIRRGLSSSENIDYYPTVAEFVSPYTLKVGEETITSKIIILCTGSKPIIPPIEGLEKVGYHTSDTILGLNQLPESIAIIGGGYIAAEYGHFFSAMGSKVTIIGRNPQFLPKEEPEVSTLAKRELQKHMTIITNHEVKRIESVSGKKKLTAINRGTGETIDVVVEEVLVAAGRGSNQDILHPEKAGIDTDERGWIKVNEYLETSQPNIWAIGDANGKHPFKHVANYEASVLYYNLVLKRQVKVDYHTIPHAVFTHPEIASFGLGQKEAVDQYGEDKVLIGIQRYQDTAKGEAMAVKDYFVKVITERETMKILGAHIIGPQASVLIQEIINLRYTSDKTAELLINAMHIHPALSEVVERAFRSLMTPKQYNHQITHHYDSHTN